MRVFKNILLSIVSLLGVVLVGLVLYVNFADLSQYKTDLEEGLSDNLGHDVTIEGPFELDVGRKIVLSAKEVVIVNTNWPDISEYLRIGDFAVTLDTLSLISGPVTIDSLDIQAVTLNLQQDETGASNWNAAPAQIQDNEPVDDDKGDPGVIVRKLGAANIVATQSVGANEIARLDIASIDLTQEPDGSTTIATDLIVSSGETSVPLQTRATLRQDSSRVSIGEFVLDATGLSLQLDGWVQTADALAGEMSILLDGPDLANFGRSVGIEGLPAAPYAVSFQTSLKPAGFEFHDVIAKIGDGLLNGSMAIDLQGERPAIVANLHSPQLDLRFPGTPEAEAEGEEVATGDTDASASLVFGDEPLHASALTAVDLQAEIFFESLQTNADTWTDVNARIDLKDGALAIDPFGLNSGSGQLSGDVKLRPQGERFELDFNLEASELRFGALATEPGVTDAIPPLNAELRLQGSGTSLHEIMSSASGAISGRQERGQINMQAAGFLFSDLVSSVLRTINPLADSDPVTTLECGVYEVDIVDGVATIEELALQTEKLTIVSSGTIDLSTEQIDMTLRTKTREGLGVSVGGVVNSFLKVGGTLSEPSVGVDAAGSVTTTGAAMATGGLSLLAKGLWDRVSAEADICAPEATPTVAE